MKKAIWIAVSVVVPMAMSLFFNLDQSIAGPPLLCHAIEIGKSESLAWGQGAWSNDKIELDDNRFVARTLELLSPDAPILARMETIRRATIHAAERPKAASNILAVLRARVAKSNESGVPDILVLFDLGYLTATYEQMNLVTERNSFGFGGGRRKEIAIPDDLSAYEFVKKASDLTKTNAEMEFALALITSSPAHSAHRRHLQNAVAGAQDGTLLAVNLVQRFSERGKTFTDLRASFGMSANGDHR